MIASTTMTDGVRLYIRMLREERRMSQDRLAQEIGLSPRAYFDWETGRTEEIKAGPLMRAITVLGGSAEHARQLVAGVSEEEIARADAVFPTLPEGEQEAIDEFAQTLRAAHGDDAVRALARVLAGKGMTHGNATLVLQAFMLGYRFAQDAQVENRSQSQPEGNLQQEDQPRSP